jgi:hypothetical protein
MSKKKNTLRDLDDFLKQQASNLVTPTPLAEKVESVVPVARPETETQPQKDELLDAVRRLASDRKKLYDLIVRSVEMQELELPEDKMLINTALYLKSGSNWRDAIRNYWHQR